MIKAIDTEYNGYKFRSRLEARWAVFFDAAGIGYLYEPEGFETPHGWYLPDFYLPNENLWLEIKPNNLFKDPSRDHKIYLAGKISKNCWRTSILNHRGQGYEPGEIWPELWPTIHIRDSLYCTGPYFCGDDHGCGHDGNAHGAAAAGCFHGQGGKGRAFKIMEACYRAIESCDTFFAWIDSLDCFGTIAEIGIAKGLFKDVLIGVDKKLPVHKSFNDDRRNNMRLGADDVGRHELWFIENLIRINSNVCHFEDIYGYSVPKNEQFQVFESATTAFDFYFPKRIMGEDELKIKAVARQKEEAYCVLYGEPMCFEHHGDKVPYMATWASAKDSHAQKSAIKARQARFEHGEKG